MIERWGRDFVLERWVNTLSLRNGIQTRVLVMERWGRDLVGKKYCRDFVVEK